ncbi:MAG: cupin domain-containing protein [Proteobacteria bacterium]|nr:cupin domain-containing protein [Pseudomonadota bacterium]
MTTRIAIGVASLLILGCAAAPLAAAGETPLVGGSKDVKWGPAPPNLPPNAHMAVLAGDPASTGLITVRLKMPAGYKVPPHWHPTDEHVTVLSGTLAVGMGDKIDRAQSKTLTAGGYGVVPANMHHYAFTRTGAVIQINLNGPFGITYVNPADDPGHKAAAAEH